MDTNVSEKMIRVAALAVQDMVIEKVIGSCLFNRLIELVCTDEICCEGNECYHVLLERYLFPIFSYGVQAEMSVPMSFKNRNNGIVRVNLDGASEAALSEIKYLNQYYLNKMDTYVQRAIRYLRCNKCFPELASCECDWAGEKPFGKKPSVTINLSMKPVCRTKIR